MGAESKDGGERRWLSIGEASRLLGVHESTLRQWADTGRVRSFRTPGGHRRFLLEDLLRLQAQEREAPPDAEDVGESALQLMRRRLRRGPGRSGPPEWMTRLDESARQRFRFLGRRLLEVVVAYLSRRRRRQAILEEVRFLGEEYGRELARHHLTLLEVLDAYFFFRNSLLDSLGKAFQGVLKDRVSPDEAWHHLLALSDTVLTGITRSYAEARGWTGEG